MSKKCSKNHYEIFAWQIVANRAIAALSLKQNEKMAFIHFWIHAIEVFVITFEFNAIDFFFRQVSKQNRIDFWYELGEKTERHTKFHRLLCLLRFSYGRLEKHSIFCHWRIWIYGTYILNYNETMFTICQHVHCTMYIWCDCRWWFLIKLSTSNFLNQIIRKQKWSKFLIVACVRTVTLKSHFSTRKYSGFENSNINY